MSKPTLFLFTQYYIEVFLNSEIIELASSFDKVYVFPENIPTDDKINLPLNVVLVPFKLDRPVYSRKLLIRHGFVVLKWFCVEFFSSVHRLKYIKEFKWNFNRLLGLLNNAKELKLTIEEYKIENPLFYTYWFNDWASILALAKEMGLKGELMSRMHAYDFDENQKGNGYHPFRYVELGKFEKIFQVSNYGVNYINSRFFCPQKVFLNRLGVEDLGKAKVGIGEEYCIVTCSNLNWYKRPLLLVELISKINLNIRWVHFGDGVFEYDFLEAASNLPPNIKLNYRGKTPHDLIIKFYQQTPIDLVVNTSSHEGIPVALMEAISFGIPIVGCKVCGVPEIVNEQTGILLEKDFNPVEGALRLEIFLKSKCRDKVFKEKIKCFWDKNYNAKTNSKALIKLLTKTTT